MKTPRRHLKGLACTLVVLLVSACAGIPSSGPVTKVADDGGFGQSTVRYSPARPSDGASPQQIVRGYLDAMLAFPVSSGTASAFLTPEAAKGWNSLTGVRVYTGPEVSSPTPSVGRGDDPSDAPGTSVDVRLSMVEDARLDRQGRYTKRGSPSQVVYRLERVGGQWRINNPQSGVLVSRKFFTDYFRQFNIYFFDRPGERLVPDPVYLAVGDQLATALVTSLVRGPLPGPERVVRTYVPPLPTLRPSVPVNHDGVADVEFNSDFGALDESASDRLAAQVVWTLRQAPDVTAVHLVGGTTALSTNGGALQPIDSWGAYGPSIAGGHAYGISSDKVVEISDDKVEPLSGAWGRDAQGSVLVAVDDAGVAGVLAGRSQVRVTNRNGSAARVIGGGRFIAPRWDDDGNLWLVDRRDSRTRVRLVAGKTVRTIDIGSLARLGVSSFTISPDGSRYAVTATGGDGSAIHVGVVVRDAKDRIVSLGDPARVSTTARHPRSAVWSSGTELAFLADSESGVQVYTAAIDGSSTRGGITTGGALLPDVDADTLVIGTGETPPRYVTDAQSRLWYLSLEGSWKLVKSIRITGLTYGR
jgi:hypothetical protein